MTVEIVVPQIGEAVSELMITEWLKQVGDEVRKGDVLFEVDSDKAIVEVEAFADGTLIEIIHGDGSTVLPQQVVGILGESDEEAPVTEAAATATPDAPEADSSVKASPVARRMAEDKGIDLAAIAGSGPKGRIVADDVRAAVAQREKPQAPTTARVNASPKAKRLAEEQNLDLTQITGTGVEGMITTDDVQQAMATTTSSARVNASPKAKRLADEHDLDLSEITGTGIDGMIVTADLQTRLAQPQPDVDVRSLSKLRQRIAQRMTDSKQQVPHFYLMVDVDVTGVNQLRRYCVDELHWERPPTYTDVLTRACALTLADMPDVNRSYSEGGYVTRDNVGIGVAVSTDVGLMVPVLPDADTLSLAATSRSLRELFQRTRDARLKPSDLSEKSMSISNLGMFGIDRFIAIIDTPDPMILAVGQVTDRVVPVDGQVVIQPMMTLTLSVDHRILDGTEGARFLSRLKARLENPFDILG